MLDGKVESTQSDQSEIYDSLYDISQEMSYDPISRHEAVLLTSHMKNFKFFAALLFGAIY
jgi:hypothetical protein